MTIITIGIGLLVPLLLLEVALRFLPVNEIARTEPVNDQMPVPRFEPDQVATFSRGWDFSIVNTVRTNNYGFVNDQDYDPSAASPLIAVIGDSYIEAVMVPYPQTAAGRLAASFGGEARVYSFATSGSALSQYLAYARYARERFRPDALLILVVGNDFDESLQKYKDWPGQTLFAEANDGTLTLVRQDFEPSLPRLAAQQSALAMYLLTNVGLSGVQQRWQTRWQTWRKPAGETWVGNTAATATQERIEDSRRAVLAFLSLLPDESALQPAQIIIAAEANRQLIYGQIGSEAAARSYFEVIRQFLLTEAGSRGYQVIDLQEPFAEHWSKHGQRFEWAEDWHWNATGHGILADEAEPLLRDALRSHPRAADTR